ncbi:MAG: ABC transporter substrate-binding protein [Deltaproteobacteria bacterium]|nr:MAG: ABC transporter substrate-binding protein [Deltaproteobacteria bacterium]
MKRFGIMTLVFFLGFAGVFSLSGTVLADAGNADTLVAVINHAPRHLNGAVQSGIATMFASSQLFATPLMFDDKWQPQPYLAKSWKISDDGLSVTLNLVEGATFHDGHPITSADVAFSIMTIKKNHPFKTMLAPVEKVDTPDPHTAILRLSKPHPAILLAMSQPLCPIIPKHIFGDGQDIKTHPMNMKPVGSGPFKFVEYKPGEHLILESYDKFFLGAPKIKRLILKIIPDSVNRLTALEQKEVDMDVFVSEARDVRRYGKIKDLVVEKMGEAVGPLNWLAFNLKHKPLDNKQVRQAISYAIDRKFITQRLHFGFSTIATGPIVPSSPFYSADVEKYDINLDKANGLLDAAGYAKKADGIRFSLSMDYIPGPAEQQKNLAEYLKASLKKIGIEVKIHQSPDFPSWAKRVSNWEFDLTMDSAWNWGDPVIGVHRTYLSSNIRKGVIWSNTQNYVNPRVDELLARAAVETDIARRKAIYAEFQKIVVDDAPIAYINTLPFHVAYDKRLKNINTTIWGSMSPMHQVYWDK